MRYADLQTVKPDRFKWLTGVSPQTFGAMLDTINAAWRDFGRPPKLSRADQLLLALSYWREYRSLAHIAMTYKVSEPTVSRTIRRVENILLQSGKFSLPGKKAIQQSETIWQFYVIDTTETPIERPKKKRKHYSGKKKCHSIKSHGLIDHRTQEIVATCFATGKTTDFRLLQRSKLCSPETATRRHTCRPVMRIRAIKAWTSCLLVLVCRPRSRVKDD